MYVLCLQKVDAGRFDAVADDGHISIDQTVQVGQLLLDLVQLLCLLFGQLTPVLHVTR